jgi:hypothetical protein
VAGPPLQGCYEVVLQCGGALWGGAHTLWLLCAGSGRLLLAPLLSAALLLASFIAQVLLPVYSVRLRGTLFRSHGLRCPAVISSKHSCRHDFLFGRLRELEAALPLR